MNDLIDRVFTEDIHDNDNKDYALQDSDYQQDQEYLIFSDDLHKNEQTKTSGITVRTVLEKASAKSSENLKIIDQLVNGEYVENDYDQEINDDIKDIIDSDHIDVGDIIDLQTSDHHENTDNSNNQQNIDVQGSLNPYLTDYLNMNYLNDDLKTINEHKIKKGILDIDTVDPIIINEEEIDNIKHPILNDYPIIRDQSYLNDNIEIFDHLNTNDHIASNDQININDQLLGAHQLETIDQLKINDKKLQDDQYTNKDKTLSTDPLVQASDSLNKTELPQIKISNIYTNREEPIEFNDYSQINKQIVNDKPQNNEQYHYYPIENIHPQNGDTKYKEINPPKREILPKSLTDVLPHKNYYPVTETSIENSYNDDILVENESEKSYARVEDNKVQKGKILALNSKIYPHNFKKQSFSKIRVTDRYTFSVI